MHLQGFEHTQGPIAKAGRGLVPLFKQFSLSSKPTSLHSALQCRPPSRLTPLLPSRRRLLNSAPRALEETGPGRASMPPPSFLCFLFLSSCFSNGFSPRQRQLIPIFSFLPHISETVPCTSRKTAPLAGYQQQQDSDFFLRGQSPRTPH